MGDPVSKVPKKPVSRKPAVSVQLSVVKRLKPRLKKKSCPPSRAFSFLNPCHRGVCIKPLMSDLQKSVLPWLNHKWRKFILCKYSRRDYRNYKELALKTTRWSSLKITSQVGAVLARVERSKHTKKGIQVTFSVKNTSKKSLQNVILHLAGIGIKSSKVIRIAHLAPGQKRTLKFSTVLTTVKKKMKLQWNGNRPMHLAITYKTTRKTKLHRGKAPAGFARYYGWLNPRFGKMGRFIYAKDATAARIAKQALAVLKKKGLSAKTIKGKMFAARFVYSYLAKAGVKYVDDPGAKIEMPPNKPREILEFHVQLPTETLYLGGDCEDLSILFNAIIHRMGIETAFRTWPGHTSSLIPIGKNISSVLIGTKRYPLLMHKGIAYLRVDLTTKTALKKTSSFETMLKESVTARHLGSPSVERVPLKPPSKRKKHPLPIHPWLGTVKRITRK